MLTRALPAHKKGGVPDHSAMLAGGLAARGHSVSVVTTRLAGSPEKVESGGVTIYYLEKTVPDEYGGSWWRTSASRTAELHRSRPFDILHCQSSAGFGVINGELHRTLGVPAVITQHGTYYDELVTRWKNGFEWNPVRSAKNLAAILIVLRTLFAKDMPYLRRADGVIATSREQEAIIRRIYGIPPEKIFTVFNGMDLSLFTPGKSDEKVRARFGIGPDAPLLLCVARLIRDKGIQNMIRAMPAVVRKRPDCRLVIVGSGPFRGGLEEIARASGVSGQVHFAGEVPIADLPGFFRDCDMFVNPTNQQNGYDLTMVEAMACARTVISSDIGSTPTLISHEKDGILFPTGDVGALAAAVLRLLEDAPLRESLSEKAREKVIGGFGLDTMVDATVEVYQRLLSAGGAEQANSPRKRPDETEKRNPFF